ncbi:hypothetical protein LR48_Vigan03g127800 [Vigna angularis]|uniref:Uncharacterized protein n=1 Tax=Phaseolus angularis TaxID=3914 RepID=A0A0L9U536_PHAAN|nr:hypothetical protein LR48_Vigan03g127800 [Vigna angularis]
MGSIKREKRVLKLVHPGKHVEVHRKPVRAEEVLRKNPRHCITRPDVFKFPWIVVKPESVLLPGSVFLIVPDHTIYDLLKASTTQTISIQSQVQTQMHNQQLKPEACDGIGFSPQMHNLFLPFLSHEPVLSQDMEHVRRYGERSENQSHVEIRSINDVSPFEFRPYYKALKYYEEAEMLDLKNGVNLEFVSSEHVTTGLKSCLRTPNSMRKNLKLKVSFNVQLRKR